MANWQLEHDGFCMLSGAVSLATVNDLLTSCTQVFDDVSESVRARSSRGHVYAANPRASAACLAATPPSSGDWTDTGKLIRQVAFQDAVQSPATESDVDDSD